MFTKDGHPLENAFSMNDPDLREEFACMELPEVKNLDLIIELALASYKSQMDNMHFVEHKNQRIHLELALKFLTEAKDAIYKKEQLVIQSNKKGTGKENPAPNKEEGEKNSGGTSRANLYAIKKEAKS